MAHGLQIRASGVGDIDNLEYSYGNTNQLKKVSDFAPNGINDLGFNENNVNLEQEYFYDANGNMFRDKNKGIDLITYNHLNLPIYIGIDQNQSKKINYVYTATGGKIRKYTSDNGVTQSQTDYVGAYVYETTNNGPELQFIQTTEGRLVPDGNGGYNYEYALKDHLGNTRVMFDETGQVLQDQSYYPFGMSLGTELTFNMPSELPDNKYLYNGKELQSDFGLGWYDYGARFYNPVLARWHSIDPLAEQYRRWSPYNYAMNNPLRIIDPDGMGTWDIVKGVALITGGAIQWVGGVAAVSSGVGAPLGVALVMSGSATIGFGTAALVNNGKENIPTGMGQALGRGYDLSTNNGSHTGEKVGAGLDFVSGILTGPVNAALSTTSNVTTVISGISTGETIINLSTSTEPQKVEADNTKTGSDKNAKSTPVKEDTKTQPTQAPNPFAHQSKKEENPVQYLGTHK